MYSKSFFSHLNKVGAIATGFIILATGTFVTVGQVEPNFVEGLPAIALKIGAPILLLALMFVVYGRLVVRENVKPVGGMHSLVFGVGVLAGCGFAWQMAAEAVGHSSFMMGLGLVFGALTIGAFLYG